MSYDGYTFHEFPKSLYRDGEHAVAADAATEKALRDDGWADWHVDQADMAKEASPAAPRKPRSPRAKKA